MSITDVVTRAKAGQFFRPRRLGHANLYVLDYLDALKFYTEVAGFREAYVQPNNLASFVSNGNTYHDVGLIDVRSRHNHEHSPAGLNHFAFEMENEAELVEGYRRAVAAGVEFESVQDHDVAHSLYMFDPDGNRVEVYADVIEDWRSNRHGIINKEKPKWIPGVTSPALTDRNYPQDPELHRSADAIFQSKKVTHVGLVAKDYPAMFGYYTGFVGLSPLVGNENSAFAVLKGTNSAGDVTLYRHRPGRVPGLHHVGCMVWDEAALDRALVAAKTAGIEVVGRIDHPIRRTVTIKDPNGVRLRFYVDRNWSAEAIAGISEEVALELL
jgi:catechol 2,3-dioxygenase